MTINNVSTYGSVQTLLQNMSQIQSELNTAENQVSSGYTSQNYQGLNGSIEQFSSLSSQLLRLQNYAQDNATTSSQLNTSYTVLGQVITVVNNMQNLVAAQISGSATTTAFQQQMSGYVTSLTGDLNTTFEGSYIFSGTSTTTPPIKTPLPAPAQIGTPDASYYQGSSQSITVTVADGQTMTNGVTADNPAFQQVFAGIALATQPNASTQDLQKAETLISDGLTGITALQAGVNTNILNLTTLGKQNSQLQTYCTQLTDSMVQSDDVTLSTQVAQDQTTLEASFEVFSRISSLSLANYLK